jgi:hypothetical protein
MNTNPLSRRHFLTRTAGLAATTFAGPNLLLRGQDTASKRLNLAIIGANGKGQSDTQAVTLAHNIVALVDVDQKRLDEAAKKNEKSSRRCSARRRRERAEALQDFRKMFDEMANEIDGVIDLHARPHALPRRHARHQARQARLRAEASVQLHR